MSLVAYVEERPVSAKALAAQGGIGPCELVAGRIVPTTPASDAHGACEGNVYQALRAFVRERGLGKVRVGEVMSPSSAWSEVVQKLREYFAIGVRLSGSPTRGSRSSTPAA
jgi:hypothetical protein